MGAAQCSRCETAPKGPKLEEQEPGRRVGLEAKAGGAGNFDIVHENRGQLNDLYEVDHALSLGEGSFSSVHLATHRETKQQRAVKVIRRILVKNAMRLEHEIQIHRSVDHPGIVRLVEALEDPRSVHLVCELCTGGELFDRIVDDAPLPELAAASLFGQMSRAVAYLHCNSIMHRDLKVENWLLAEPMPKKVAYTSMLEKAVLRLADFGCARTLGPGESAKTKIGSPYYVAPEVLKGPYWKSADVWALGVTLYMLLGGLPLVSGNNTEEVLKSVECLRPHEKLETLWASLGKKQPSAQAKVLVRAVLDKEPTRRPTAQDIAKDRWLTAADASAPPVLARRGASAAERLAGTTRAAQAQASQPDASAVAALGNVRKYRLASAERPPPSHVAARWERMAIAMVVAQLDRKALRDLELLFFDLDTNRDGTLSWQELQDGFRCVGTSIADTEAKRLHEALDADGSGAVDFSEFVAAAVDDALIAKENACWKAFKAFDVDASGSIERAEMERLLTSGDFNPVEVEAFNELFHKLDKSGEGCVDFDEFRAFLRPLGRAGEAGE